MTEVPGGAASAGAIKATIDFDAAGLQRAVDTAMRKATASIEGSIDRSMAHVESSMRDGFRKVGGSILAFLGLDTLASGVQRVGAFILRTGRETEAALNNFRAVSGATADEMKEVGEVAAQLGNDISLPGTSAGDAALAMTELAKAGFSVNESMEAARGTLQLATAAQIDAADAAEISSKQLQAFGLNVDKAGFVADVLANAANATSADMQGMADSLNQAGAVAHASGLGFAETASAIALMADNAIVGSDAGTSLKSMLVALQAPSGKAAQILEDLNIEVYDQQGNMKSLAGIVRELEQGTKGLTQQQKQQALVTIFGTDAIRAINVLMNQGSTEVEHMTEALQTQGAAAKLAAANSKGLVGSLGALQSNIESIADEIYQKAAPALDRALRGALDALPGILEATSAYLNQMIDALTPAAQLLGEFMEAAAPGALIAFKTALGALLVIVKGLALVLEPLVDLIESNEDAFHKIITVIVAVTIAVKAMKAAVQQAQEIYTSPKWNGAVSNVKRLGTTMRSTALIAASLRTAGSGLVAALGGPWGIAIGAAAVAVGIFAQKQAEADAHVRDLTESLDEQTGAMTDNTRQQVIAALEDKGVLKTAEELGLSIDTVTEAAFGSADALAELKAKLDDAEEGASALRAENPGDFGDADELRELVGTVEDEANALDGAAASWRRKELASRAATAATIRSIGADQSAKDAALSISSANEDVIRTKIALRSRTDAAGKAFEDEADKADHATRAIKGLNDAAIKGISAQIDFEQASDDLTGVIKHLKKEAIDNGRALDTNFQAGRDVYSAFVNLVTAADGVKGGMARAREQIFNTIRPMVDSKAEAEKLTDQFFKVRDAANQVPHDVTVHAHADVNGAIAELHRLTNEAAAVKAASIGVGGVTRRATGGPIFGPGTGTSDEVLIAASNGEHMWTADEVKAAGGHAGVFALRQAVKSGALARLADQQATGALVDRLSISVGSRDDLPEALGEAMFHLRRFRRGSRYN